MEIPYETLICLSRIGIEIFNEKDFNKNETLVNPLNELTKKEKKKSTKK